MYVKIAGIGIIVVAILGGVFALIIRKNSKKSQRQFSSLGKNDIPDRNSNSPSDENKSRITMDSDPQNNFDRELDEVSIEGSVKSEDRSYYL